MRWPLYLFDWQPAGLFQPTVPLPPEGRRTTAANNTRQREEEEEKGEGDRRRRGSPATYPIIKGEEEEREYILIKLSFSSTTQILLIWQTPTSLLPLSSMQNQVLRESMIFFKNVVSVLFPQFCEMLYRKAILGVLLCLAPVHCINFKILPSLPQTYPRKTCFALEIDLPPPFLLFPPRKLIGWDSRVETRKNSKGKKQQQRRERNTWAKGEKNNVFVVFVWAISVGKVVL